MWNEQDLDGMHFLAPNVRYTMRSLNDSNMRERVSDYIQKFLVRRYQKFSINLEKSPASRNLRMKEQEAYVKDMNTMKEKSFAEKLFLRDEKRRLQEQNRIKVLILSGKTEPADDFFYLKNTPHFRLNELNRRIAELQKKFPKPEKQAIGQTKSRKKKKC